MLVVVILIRQQHYSRAVSYLSALNVDVSRALSRVEAPDWLDGDPEEYVPLIYFVRAFQAGVRSGGLTDLSHVVADEMDVSDLGALGRCVSKCATVREALAFVCRAGGQEATTLQFWMTPVSNGMLVCRKQPYFFDELADAFLQIHHYTLSIIVETVRLGAGPDWTPSDIYLPVSKDTAARRGQRCKAAQTVAGNSNTAGVDVGAEFRACEKRVNKLFIIFDGRFTC